MRQYFIEINEKQANEKHREKEKTNAKSSNYVQLRRRKKLVNLI